MDIAPDKAERNFAGIKAEAVAYAGNPRGGSPLSRFNEGFPKGGENEIFPLWRFFAYFLIAQKVCSRRENGSRIDA